MRSRGVRRTCVRRRVQHNRRRQIGAPILASRCRWSRCGLAARRCCRRARSGAENRDALRQARLRPAQRLPAQYRARHRRGRSYPSSACARSRPRLRAARVRAGFHIAHASARTRHRCRWRRYRRNDWPTAPVRPLARVGRSRAAALLSAWRLPPPVQTKRHRRPYCRRTCGRRVSPPRRAWRRPSATRCPCGPSRAAVPAAPRARHWR